MEVRTRWMCPPEEQVSGKNPHGWPSRLSPWGHLKEEKECQGVCKLTCGKAQGIPWVWWPSWPHQTMLQSGHGEDPSSLNLPPHAHCNRLELPSSYYISWTFMKTWASKGLSSFSLMGCPKDWSIIFYVISVGILIPSPKDQLIKELLEEKQPTFQFRDD